MEQAGKAWELMDPHSVIVCADHEHAMHWADAAPAELPVHAVTGLARTAALLKDGRVGILAGSPADLAALVAPSALEEFFERHARRPEIIGDMPLDDVGRPLGPVASARYAIVAAGRKRFGDVLDALKSVRPYVWFGGPVAAPPETPDAVVAAVLPTRDELRLLAAIAQPTLVALASQLPYLRSIATLSPLALPSPADRAQDRNAQLRAQISARLRQGDVDAELAVLAPLFEEHAPAMVAAALLAISRQPSIVPPAAPVAEPPAGWAKVFVTVGRKDNASAKDLVGALIKEVGLQKGQIGKIDVRETFSLVEVAAQVADEAVRRLTGVTIRGRRIAARPDRG